jgi:hypothetical protein
VRPAPQAGCFVSRLSISCESQATCDSFAFGTVAAAPSSTLVSWTGYGAAALTLAA